MRTITLQRKLSLFVVAILIVVAIILIFIVMPATKTILRLTDSVKATEIFLEQEYQRSKNLQKSLRELGTIQEETKKYNASRIASGSELEAITELETLALESGMNQTLSINQNGNDSVTFSFLNIATFEKHIQYLKQIELLPQYMSIDSLDFQRQGAASGTSTPVRLRFSATVGTK